jgi:hypothetical protein
MPPIGMIVEYSPTDGKQFFVRKSSKNSRAGVGSVPALVCFVSAFADFHCSLLPLAVVEVLGFILILMRFQASDFPGEEAF